MRTAWAVSLITGSIFCTLFTFTLKQLSVSTPYLLSFTGNACGVIGAALLLISMDKKRNGPKGRESQHLEHGKCKHLPEVPGKAVEDAEAEAVLLALGPQLEWALKSGGWWFGKQKRSFYYVGTEDNGQMYAFKDIYPRLFYEGQLTSIAQAKAACERHHATGKWE